MLYCSVRLFAWIGLDDGADCWGVIVRAGRIEFRKKLGFVVLVVWGGRGDSNPESEVEAVERNTISHARRNVRPAFVGLLV
jgi:hypothetical protein